MTEQNYLACDDCASRKGFFDCISEEESVILCSNRKKLNFQSGEYLVKQGNAASYIGLVRKGLVKIAFQSREQNLILSLETTGAFLALPVLFKTKVFPYSVISVGETDCCQFDINNFQQVMRMNGEFASRVTEHLNDYTLRSIDRLFTLTAKQLHGRFADILLCLRNRIYGVPQFTLDLTRKDLAEISNMTSESLSRVIRDFNEDGICMIEGREVKILDMDKLEKISHLG